MVRSLRGVCEASKTATRPPARNGGEVKAVGIVSPTALLFEQATQYKISKIKLSISTIAVTPATESTKASLACHSYLFESGVEMAFDARYRDKDGEISHDSTFALAASSKLACAPTTPFLRGQAFDPETVKAIGDALIITCETLGVSERDDASIQLIARKIIELAERGLKNTTALHLAALKEFKSDSR